MDFTWSEAAVRALGVRTDVETAGSIFGLSRTQSYEAVRTGRFPVKPVKIGRRIVVPVAPIVRLLGLDMEAGASDEQTTQADERSDESHGKPPRIDALGA